MPKINKIRVTTTFQPTLTLQPLQLTAQDHHRFLELGLLSADDPIELSGGAGWNGGQ
ncbi:tsl2174 [Thermosynechococcus vestitus BP-1]|uniref:Tsl2174 protein n=1 Tax=Thermosynechococcus vestitus (strain NIES-2133 / IAM M-273 / BP-1) TaxID=197221 RepID=Q8DGY8_THEVB|nr:tsl2174 [Thermosynechococcus vestitus BP-1]